MKSKLGKWFWLWVLISCMGCAMCASPYDYCGPTFSAGEGCEACDHCAVCDPLARAGSVLSPPLSYQGAIIEGIDEGVEYLEAHPAAEPTPAKPPANAAARRAPQALR